MLFERNVFASSQHGKPFLLKGNLINWFLLKRAIFLLGAYFEQLVYRTTIIMMLHTKQRSFAFVGLLQEDF